MLTVSRNNGKIMMELVRLVYQFQTKTQGFSGKTLVLTGWSV